MDSKKYLRKMQREHPEAWRAAQRDISLKVSNLITDIRIKHGLSQKELAERIKTKQPAISRAEMGYHCSTALLQRIADEFDIIIKIHL